MRCPNCGTGMDEVTIAGVAVDFCAAGCRGLFFDNRELERMDQTHEAAEDPTLQSILADGRERDERSAPLVCPRCEIKMRRHAYALGTGIHIDRCYGCNGIWLDKGELAAVRENFKTAEQRKRNVETLLSAETDLGAKIAAREQQMRTEKATSEQRERSARTMGLLGGIFGRY